MDSFSEQHLDRIETAVQPKNGEFYSKWIPKNTRLKGKLFSWNDHAYQKVIAADEAREQCIRKPSQVGISELMIRWVLAFSLLNRGVTTIYSLPTAMFAQKFAKTRFDVVIDESPNVKSQIYPGADSAMVKRFLCNSMVFFNGASRSSQVISVPADYIVQDEKDFAEDQEILTQLHSRLTHSEFKKLTSLSTPTVDGYGISEDFENSVQFIELTRCNHCNHYFDPDYFEDVVIPGFLGDIKEFNYLNKSLLTQHRVNEAFLACPRCRRPVNTGEDYREFVVKNPDSNAEMHGYQITPFSCPSTRPAPEIIKTATKYKRYADFINFGLGLPATTSENALSEEEIEAAFVSDARFPDKAPVSVMGLDMGGQCACFTGAPFPDGHLHIYHAELIPLHRLHKTYREIAAEQRVIASVIDALPYTDTVKAIQGVDHSSWACLFRETKSTELFTVQEKEEDESKATYGLRQITAQRDMGLDFVVSMLRSGKLTFSRELLPLLPVISKHLRDLKRIKLSDKYGEDIYTWRKSSAGQDHFFFALLYLVLATFMRGVSGGSVALPSLVMKIKTNGNT